MALELPIEIKEKLCFLCSSTCISISIYFYVARPAVVIYLFSVIFVLSMIARMINYWRAKYILFMLDMCYLINTLSLIMVWGFPKSIAMRYVQFSLANAHAYWGSFLYRNTLVFHDFQKLVSCFIHVLPVLFSFLLRWFPDATSIGWYTSFATTGVKTELLVWMNDMDWFYQFLVPLLVFTAREILYYLIIYGCVKPGDAHLDTYRYMHKKKFLAMLFWDRFNERWHLLIWIVTGIVATALVLCVALISWSCYLFHCIMLCLQLLSLCWNGACYYVDYYPAEVQRRRDTSAMSKPPYRVVLSDSKCPCDVVVCNGTPKTVVPPLLRDDEPERVSQSACLNGDVCLPVSPLSDISPVRVVSHS